MQGELIMDETIDIKAFTKRIKTIREALGLNQNEFAKSLNTSASNLSQIEKGNHLPGSDVLITLQAKYRINFDYLYSGEGKMFREKDEDGIISTLGDDLYMKEEEVKKLFYYYRRSQYCQYYVALKITALFNSPEFGIVEEEVRKYESKKNEAQEKEEDVSGP